MNDDRRCASCANWFPSETKIKAKPAAAAHKTGECRRYAPRPLVVESRVAESALVLWPVTQADDTCGEWYFGGPRLDQSKTDAELSYESTLRAGAVPRPLA
jgi:hypothetical protein